MHMKWSDVVRCGLVWSGVLISQTAPLSSLIGASSISHLLYADDTQLLISFVPKNFSSAIDCIHWIHWQSSFI